MTDPRAITPSIEYPLLQITGFQIELKLKWGPGAPKTTAHYHNVEYDGASNINKDVVKWKGIKVDNSGTDAFGWVVRKRDVSTTYRTTKGGCVEVKGKGDCIRVWITGPGVYKRHTDKLRVFFVVLEESNNEKIQEEQSREAVQLAKQAQDLQGLNDTLQDRQEELDKQEEALRNRERQMADQKRQQLQQDPAQEQSAEREQTAIKQRRLQLHREQGELQREQESVRVAEDLFYASTPELQDASDREGKLKTGVETAKNAAQITSKGALSAARMATFKYEMAYMAMDVTLQESKKFYQGCLVRLFDRAGPAFDTLVDWVFDKALPALIATSQHLLEEGLRLFLKWVRNIPIALGGLLRSMGQFLFASREQNLEQIQSVNSEVLMPACVETGLGNRQTSTVLVTAGSSPDVAAQCEGAGLVFRNSEITDTLQPASKYFCEIRVVCSMPEELEGKPGMIDYSSHSPLMLALKISGKKELILVDYGPLQQDEQDDSWDDLWYRFKKPTILGPEIPKIEFLVLWLDLKRKYAPESKIQGADFTAAVERVEVRFTGVPNGDQEGHAGSKTVSIPLNHGSVYIWDAANSLMISNPGTASQVLHEQEMHVFGEAGWSSSWYWHGCWRKKENSHTYYDQVIRNCFSREVKWVGPGAGSGWKFYRKYSGSKEIDQLQKDCEQFLLACECLPCCSHLRYFFKPTIHELRRCLAVDSNYLKHVPGFVIGHEEYGEIHFKGNMDVRNLPNLSDVVVFGHGSVSLTSDETADPLRKPAKVTFYNVKQASEQVDLSRILQEQSQRQTQIASVEYKHPSGEVLFDVKQHLDTHEMNSKFAHPPVQGPATADDIIAALQSSSSDNATTLKLDENMSKMLDAFRSIENPPVVERFEIWRVFEAMRSATGWASVHMTQQLAVAIMLQVAIKNRTCKKHDQQQHLVMEMLTGEGKSAVLAMVAAAICLRDKQAVVDVITSSPILARRDCAKWDPFFASLGLSASHNCDDQNPGQSFPYSHRIVYGTVANFAGDRLRTEFEKKRVCFTNKSNRPFDVLLIDEVDYLLLDKGTQLTYLSDDFPSMHHMTSVLSLIWLGACNFHSKPFLSEDGIAMFAARSAVDDISLEGFDEAAGWGLPEHVQQGELRIWELPRNGRLRLGRSVWIKESKSMDVLKQEDGNVRLLLTGSELSLFLTTNTMEAITFEDKIGGDGDEEIFTYVPSHLKPFLAKMIPVYAQSAVQALRMLENKDYVLVRNGDRCVISPVDGATGVTQMMTHWDNGLHQFLQLKHGVEVTQPRLTSNFISNLHLVQRYSAGSILGLTGTVGTSADLNFLQENFSVSACKMLPRLPRRVEEYEPMLVYSRDEWLDIIASDVQMCRERSKVPGPSLVLCKDIRTAQEVTGHLRMALGCGGSDAHDGFKIISYVRSDEGDDPLKDRKFAAKEVIVATNLASRGTDILLADSARIEGLHVVLTYLPSSFRAERQAYGRAGRQGIPGSYRLVALRSELPRKSLHWAVNDVRAERDRLQSARIERIQNTQLKQIEWQEKMFRLFCETFRPDAVMSDPFAGAMCEQWALWLQIHIAETDSEPLPNYEASMLPVEAWKLQYSCWDEGVYGGMSAYQAAEAAARILRLCDSQEGSSDNAYSLQHRVDDLLAFACREGPKCALISGYLSARRTLEKGIETAKNKSEIDSATENAKEALRSTLHVVNRFVSEFQQVSNAKLIFKRMEQMSDVTENEDLVDSQLAAQLHVLQYITNNINRNIAQLDRVEWSRILIKHQELANLVASSTDSEVSMLQWCAMLGISHVFEVEEKPPPFSFSALACFFIGIGQVIAGAAIMVCSLGTAVTVGMGFIQEGVSDIVAGVQGMVTGAFSWAEWAIQKAISVGTSLLCAGIAKMKALVSTVVKSARAGAAAGGTAKSSWYAARDAAKAAVNKVKTETRVISSSFVAANKAGTRKLANETGKIVAKKLGVEAIMQGVNYALSEALEWLRGMIVEYLTKRFRDSICADSDLWTAARRFFAAQKQAGSEDTELLHHFNQLVVQHAVEAMQRNSKAMDTIRTICEYAAPLHPIIEGALLVEGFYRAVAAMAQVAELDSVMKQAMHDLLNKLSRTTKEVPAGSSGCSDIKDEEWPALMSAAQDAAVAAYACLVDSTLARNTQDFIHKVASRKINSVLVNHSPLSTASNEERITEAGAIRYAMDDMQRVADKSNLEQDLCQAAELAAANIEKPGHELGTLEVSAMATSQNCTIVVTDQNGSTQVFNPQAPGEPVLLRYDSDERHYSPLGKDGVPINLPSVRNSCLPAAVAHACGRGEDEIRKETAAIVRKMPPETADLVLKYQHQQNDPFMVVFTQPGGTYIPQLASFSQKHVVQEGDLDAHGAARLQQRTDTETKVEFMCELPMCVVPSKLQKSQRHFYNHAANPEESRHVPRNTVVSDAVFHDLKPANSQANLRAGQTRMITNGMHRFRTDLADGRVDSGKGYVTVVVDNKTSTVVHFERADRLATS